MPTDLKKYRRQKLLQLLLLVVICLLISQISWIAGRGKLTIPLSPYEAMYPKFSSGESSVYWEQDSLPVNVVVK